MGLGAVIDGLVAVEATIAPTGWGLGVYRWWEPHMAQPCVWNELTSSSRTERPDSCTVEDYLRVDVVIVPPPASDHGRDMRLVEDVADAACTALDAALRASAPFSGALAAGRRLGLSTTTERLGSEQLLAFRVPLELKLRRTYP